MSESFISKREQPSFSFTSLHKEKKEDTSLLHLKEMEIQRVTKWIQAELKTLASSLLSTKAWKKIEHTVGQLKKSFNQLAENSRKKPETHEKHLAAAPKKQKLDLHADLKKVEKKESAKSKLDFLTRSQNAKFISNKLRQAFPGIKDFQVAGILGNLQHESGLDSTSLNNRAFGLAQWTGTRRKQLYKFAGKTPEDEKRLAPIDLATQVDFMIHELNEHNLPKNGVKAGNRIWALRWVLRATTVDDATNAFLVKYEAPGFPKSPKRVASAKNFEQILFS